MSTGEDSQYIKERSPAVKRQAAIWFAVGIAAIGAIMMTVASSPTAKGATFLWLPAALQIMAGVWLGPILGMLAGGLGAYAAGILAYGGWGLVDIIMNPIAGGIGNALIPGILFRVFKIDPSFGASPKDVIKAAIRMFVVLLFALLVGWAVRFLNIGTWGYLLVLLIVLVSPLIIRDLNLKRRDFVIALVIAVIGTLVSALFGVLGQVVGGKAWQAAFLDTFLPWFSGDTISAILGLYLMAIFTKRARAAGIAD